MKINNTQIKNIESSNLVSANKLFIEGEIMYSLTDLWKASGKENKNSPKFFLAKSGNHICEYLEKEFGSKPVAKVVGAKGGTWAVKELVYAYAMWISPEFHVKVVRAFDQLATGNVTQAYETATGRRLTSKQQQEKIYMLRDNILNMHEDMFDTIKKFKELEKQNKEIGTYFGKALVARRGQKKKFEEIKRKIECGLLHA